MNFIFSALKESVYLLYNGGERSSPTLSVRERGIFDALFARYIAYVNPASRLPAHLSLGAYYEQDAASGLADDPHRPSKLERQESLNWLVEKRIHLAKNIPLKGSVARRVEHNSEDRLVLSGFAKIVDFLAEGLDIRYSQIVRKVDWTITDEVHVETDKGDIFSARFCVVTLPVGVLKGLHHDSAVTFTPLLPAKKRKAIDNLGIPHPGAATHNKVSFTLIYPGRLF